MWIYALAVVAVFSLALAYVPSLLFAGGVALAFSLHPVHSEAVDSVAGRSELMCLIFSLASLLLFLRALRQSAPWAAFASACCMALACLSKETGAVLPGVFVVHALVFTRWEANTRAVRRVATCLRAIAPHATILVLYLLVRLASLGRFSPEHTVLGSGDIGTRVHTIGAVFAEYARLLVFPRDLHVDYFYQHDPGIQIAASTQSVLGGVLLVSLAACACWLFARALRRSGDPDLGGLCLCALALFFGFLLPVSHVIDFGALLAERFVFAPSLGFLLAIGLPAAAWLGRSGFAVRATAIGLAITLSIVAVQRSRERADEWRDELRLWSTEAEASPADPRVLANLGAAQLHHADYDGARGSLVRALEIDPGHVSALNNLAFANLQTDRLEEAAIRYRETLAIATDNFIAWNGLGVVATKQQDPARALRYFERAILLNPNYATAQRNLRAAREATGAAQRFLATHRERAGESGDPDLLARVAQACHATGDYSCAEQFAQRAATKPHALGARPQPGAVRRRISFGRRPTRS